jgi:hypothetical protein
MEVVVGSQLLRSEVFPGMDGRIKPQCDILFDACATAPTANTAPWA